MLFEEIVFGPIYSRRLGNSLGINLLPTERKFCNYDCVYCECGWNPKGDSPIQGSLFRKYEDLKKALESKLKTLQAGKEVVDSITFSGNGEPTLHPEFGKIIDMVLELRNIYAPFAMVSVLTNATQLHRSEVFEALHKIDNPILKLDAGTAEMRSRINGGVAETMDMENLVNNLAQFGGKAIVQTLLLRGEHAGKKIDNTTDEEFELWLKYVERIKPRSVMLYAIDRETPEKHLEKLSKNELEHFADKIRAKGIPTDTFD